MWVTWVFEDEMATGEIWAEAAKNEAMPVTTSRSFTKSVYWFTFVLVLGETDLTFLWKSPWPSLPPCPKKGISGSKSLNKITWNWKTQRNGT